MSSPDQKLIQYLNEAHATELALVSTLRAHISMSPTGSYRSLLERHLGETQRQADRLERRLSDLGAGRSLVGSGVGAVQSLIGQVLSLAKGPVDLLRGSGGEEKLLKNAKDECATEALEIATYDALEQVALELGDELTAELADRHRDEEENMLAELREQIPGLARDAVAATVYGRKAYDRSEVGAAQAARSAARAATDATESLGEEAVSEAEQVASTAAGAAKETAKQARKVPGFEEAEGEARGAVSDESDLPIANYDSLKAAEVVDRLPRLSQVELGQVDAYERRHADRKTVTAKIDSLRGEEPWAG
jgi:ferritin-like metal-binding protein YciE